jgi:hypothetical protein
VTREAIHVAAVTKAQNCAGQARDGGTLKSVMGSGGKSHKWGLAGGVGAAGPCRCGPPTSSFNRLGLALCSSLIRLIHPSQNELISYKDLPLLPTFSGSRRWYKWPSSNNTHYHNMESTKTNILFTGATGLCRERSILKPRN